MFTKHALILLVSSFTKFVLVVYPLAQIAEGTFRAGSHSLTPFVAWVGLLAFALQAYMISSLVSDLAVALAEIRGQPQRVGAFDASYLSRSVGEFWKRWLGWQHPDHSGAIPAIAITAVVAAIYLGTSLSLLAWAAFMGALVTCEKRYFADRALWHRLPGPLCSFLTFLVLLFAWVRFRAANFEHAWVNSRALYGQNELNEAA